MDIPFLFQKYNKINLKRQILTNKKLSSNEKIVLMEIYDFIDISYNKKNIDFCYLTIETIVEDTGISKKTVIQSIKKLEKLNFIKVDREFKRSNHYYFLSNNFNKKVKSEKEKSKSVKFTPKEKAELNSDDKDFSDKNQKSDVQNLHPIYKNSESRIQNQEEKEFKNKFKENSTKNEGLSKDNDFVDELLDDLIDNSINNKVENKKQLEKKDNNHIVEKKENPLLNFTFDYNYISLEDCKTCDDPQREEMERQEAKDFAWRFV